MKNSNVSRGTFKQPTTSSAPSRADIVRTLSAVTLAVALLATGAIGLPSLSPIAGANEITAEALPQLEPQILADIEGVHQEAGMLTAPMFTVASIAKAVPSATVRVARATSAVSIPASW